MTAEIAPCSCYDRNKVVGPGKNPPFERSGAIVHETVSAQIAGRRWGLRIRNMFLQTVLVPFRRLVLTLGGRRCK